MTVTAQQTVNASIYDVAIGIDVGGTKIAAGLVDRQGRVRVRRTIPTHASRGGEPVLADALALGRSLKAEATANGWHVVGLGVALCELVDPRGAVMSDYTVKWRGLPVQAAFNQIAPAIVDADVRAHALGEATFGAGAGRQDFVFVSVGSGISSCLVQHGQPRLGVHGNALVLATMPVVVFDEHDRKIEFALEAFASGTGLTERYRRHRANVSGVEEIVIDAERGSAAAAAILRSGGEALGSAVAWLVNVLDPEAIVVGGGLGLAGGLYWQSMVTAARSHIFADASREVPIVTAMCGADAGLIGAAVRLFQA